MSNDAAFREAVEALIDGVVNSPQDESETTALRARVLALYAERQGEVYEATDIHNRHGIRVRVIKVPPQEFGVGDRVRVTKVEEGR